MCARIAGASAEWGGTAPPVSVWSRGVGELSECFFGQGVARFEGGWGAGASTAMVGCL